ncbi:hypothetical protein BGZ65_001975, partial [Modicella reniformis]
MSKITSQAFRAQFSSKVIVIPTRHDTKSGQRIVRWKDIQQCFKDAQYIMNGEEVVLFLTDDDLDDLIPLRIAHHPDVVLDVVTADSGQNDSSSTMNPGSTLVLESNPSSIRSISAGNVSDNDSGIGGSQSLVARSSDGIRPFGRNATALRITEIDDNQALVVRTQGLLSSEIPVHGTEERSDQLLLEMDSAMALQEQLCQLKHVVERIQQQMHEVQQTIQQTDQQKQHIDGIVQKMEQQSQQVAHSQQQARQQMQQVDQQQQLQQQQIEENLQRTQQTDQQTQHHHQQIQERIEEATQMTQQIDQQKQQIDEIMQKGEQKDQQAEQSQQQVQQNIKETLQKIQEVDQKQQQIEEILQKTHQMDQQLQQQIDEVSQRVQQIDQQVEKSQQQMQHHIEETSQNIGQMDQEVYRAFDRFALVQYRVQSILTMSFQEMSAPRLFIVLPKETAMVDEQGKPYPFQFRLYYLCECGSLTTGENTNETQEIHMAKHSGYDLVNPNEFIDKYGTYLLTMMYMVKYGSNTDRRKVPPLLGLHLANDVETDQEDLEFVKKNIRRLVSATIFYLEDAVGAINEDLDASTCRELGTLDLEELKSYLQVEHDESVTGDLCQTTTQDGNCVWICSEHQLEYHQSTMQRLESVITASSGSYYEEAGEVKVKITSDEFVKRFYDAMIKLRGIQSARNLPSPAVLELKLDCHGVTKRLTTDIIAIKLSTLNSLTLDFERHSITTEISQGEVAMKIVRLSEMTSSSSSN